MYIPDDRWNTRILSRILSLYYLDALSQSEIAQKLGLSTTKVNRLLRQARDQGMVEIRIKIPSQEVYDMERQIEKQYGLCEAVVTPGFTQEEENSLQNVGEAAAGYLLGQLQGGETICMGGGRALLALVQAIQTDKSYDVKVIPAIGGVQGTHYSDVNYLAAELARRLGGYAYQLHAPAFVDSLRERDSLYIMNHVKEILDLASHSQIALVGIGSLIPEVSSYFQFTSLSMEVVARIARQEQGIGEILARIFDTEGRQVAPDYANRVIGLDLPALQAIPHTIGVAASQRKVISILGALRGRFINTLITDEAAALGILENHGTQINIDATDKPG